MYLLSKQYNDRRRKDYYEEMVEAIQQLNNITYPEQLDERGPNVFQPICSSGLYFICNDEGVFEGAILCSDYRDVITIGLGPEHADTITSVVFFDAIVLRGIKPLQTFEHSIPPDLRAALGFIGPEKDQYNKAIRWVFRLVSDLPYL